MGKSPDDIAGEIEHLRKESDEIVDELMRRATIQNVARGATTTVMERATSAVSGVSSALSDVATTATRVADDMPEPIRQHSMAATYTVVGLLAGILGFAVSWAAVMRKPRATDRAAWRLRGSRRKAKETVRDWRGRFGDLRRGVGDVRVMTVREEPSMVKRVLWAGLASVMATLGSLLFKRLTASFWRTTMKEEPPRT